MRDTPGLARERGFTLIELMVVVAIIAVLAVIVVPQFTRETHKARATTEVNAMISEISTKEETYKDEFNAYLAEVKCPSSTPTSSYNFKNTCITTNSNWEKMRINPPSDSLRCAYTISVGAKTDTLTVPSGFKTSQGGTGAEPALASSWWYILADCDEDSQGGTNAQYYASSVDPTIQVQNAGQ